MKAIKEFLKLESSGGLVLIFATAAAIVAANGYFSSYYDSFLETTLSFVIGTFELKKPLLLWINDGLMVIFFFLIGLELKREFVAGHLAKVERVMLPAIGAVGGVVGPALVFYFFNHNDPVALSGWAIPAATDIAFALGILSLCSKKVPTWAKLFLLTLAIIDDLAAIIIIALFYTDDISLQAILFGVTAILGLYILKQRKVKSNTPYILIGVFLWICVLKSGVHATLAGVITALFMPVNDRTQQLEHDLHPWVAFGILPLFAFSNTGISLSQISYEHLIHPVTLGCALGLFAGKQIGIFFFCLIPILFKKLALPKHCDFKSLYGISLLAGIGFTMSLFISSLAYGDSDISFLLEARMGILIGSFASAVFGYLILKHAFKVQKAQFIANKTKKMVDRA